MESGNAYTAWSHGWRIESWEHGEMGVHNGKSLFELNYFIEDIKFVKCDFKKLKWLTLERNIFRLQTWKRSASRDVKRKWIKCSSLHLNAMENAVFPVLSFRTSQYFLLSLTENLMVLHLDALLAFRSD